MTETISSQASSSSRTTQSKTRIKRVMEREGVVDSRDSLYMLWSGQMGEAGLVVLSDGWGGAFMVRTGPVMSLRSLAL